MCVVGLHGDMFELQTQLELESEQADCGQTGSVKKKKALTLTKAEEE